MTETPPATPDAGAAGKPAETEQPKLEISASRQFQSWLAEQGASLAFTTYQAGKLFLIGRAEDNRLSVFERTLSRCMGMTVHGNALYTTSLYQLWRFENALAPGQTHNGFDALYVPQLGYVTGDLDIHDLAVDGRGRLVFVNTLFSCLATPSETHSFSPVWQPPHITKLAAEDRCHLNGLALRDGAPRYVTAVSRTDLADGWREHRVGGGVLIEVPSGETLLEGLSMPHSPRFYRDRVWLHDSGNGWFGSTEPGSGKFERLAFCPGYLRGLAFTGDYAVMGLSKSRGDRVFAGLPLEQALEEHKAEPRCGIYVVDLRSGDVVHWMRIEGVVKELYDVAVIPNVKRPMAIGFQSDEIRRVISVGAAAP